MTKPIDIFITTYERQHFAKECVEYLYARTRTPFKLTIIDNGGNEWAETDSRVQRYVPLHRVFGNTGVHFAWNVAVSLADSEYFITSDPDLLVPDLDPIEGSTGEGDWLSRMVQYMNQRSNYGAISMCPHVFIGAEGIPVDHPEDVLERNMCGAVFRIMRTDFVKSVGGWELRIEAGRNHEERTVCSRLQNSGYKTGICSRIRAYHNFGQNWGYPEEFTPEMQKHNPDLKEYVLSFDRRENYDEKTWWPK
jgi:GT2 family glycosyltransferase